MTRTCSVAAAVYLWFAIQASACADSPAAARCAVVGGLNEIDFWPDLADRFARDTGMKLEIAATGPKQVVVEAFRAGEADFIAAHAGDALVNLVADGLAENLQPFARNDFLIVGPASDPAGIRGQSDAAVALQRIVSSRSKLLLHASGGAAELLTELQAAAAVELDPEATISLPSDKHRRMLARAAAESAYTIVGRIPFVNGKIERGGLASLVQGDHRLRRAYLMAVRTGPQDDAGLIAARRLADYLREPSTQEWISQFGKGRYDNRPLLFPVSVP
jgi:tungstate transport system substrate-binding protein